MPQPAPIELSRQVHSARYFSFAPRPRFERTALSLFFGGFEKCRPDYRIERRGFPVFLMEYVEDGAGTLELQGHRYPLGRGAFFFYGPGISCRILNQPEEPLSKYFFAFRCSEATAARIRAMDQLFFVPMRGRRGVGELVRALFQEAIVPDAGSWRICCHYLDIILLKCQQSQRADRFNREGAWEVFHNVRDYISQHFLTLWRMEDIAAAAGLDASYISRLFKRYHHTTPYQFLMARKMEHALDLLLQSGLSVQATARQCGFEDPFHFSRVFKQYKGISPSHVRSNMRTGLQDRDIEADRHGHGHAQLQPERHN